MSGSFCRSNWRDPTLTACATTPEGMIRIEGGEYLFRVQGMEIEGSDDVGVDVQYPWEDSPRRFHEHVMQIKPFSSISTR
jgi:iron(II)-dependent oxidoreductase